MNTATISAEINAEFIPTFKVLLKQFKAKSIKIEEKDPTKMTKEEFFAKIDRAREGEKVRMSREEMRKMLLSE